jgi:glutathione S-transferase
MKLYGTLTSPFVRKVRVVAAELGEAVERVDTATPAGRAALREVTPIAKVPAAEVDGRLLFDSHVIVDWLVTTRGWHELTPPRDVWRTHNIVNAIDAALDSMIQLFYLRRDGVAVDGTAYAERQLERADAIFTWLGKELAPGGRSFERGLGIAEISLIATLDWLDFRDVYPTKRAGAVESVRAAWREHPSIAATRPESL